MASLRPGLWIHVEAIYAWSAVLNNEERYRQQGTPRRLFCIPQMLNDNDYTLSDGLRIQKFIQNMTMVLKGAESSSIKDYRLIFVPVISSDHYYLITFDLQTCDIMVIDNSAIDMVDFKTRYKGWPEKIASAFSGYLLSKNHPNAKKIKTSNPVKLEFPWRTFINTKDCGVFLMRHMETYKGTPVKDWVCGLSTEKNDKGEWTSKQAVELETLRHKYAAKILLSEINIKRHMIESEVQKFGSLSANYKKKLEMTAISRIMSNLELN